MATPRTMKAVQYDKYGGGAQGLMHVEVPVPSPKKDEVLLKMEAASINPIDWKIQKGMLRPFLPGKFPFTPAHSWLALAHLLPTAAGLPLMPRRGSLPLSGSITASDARLSLAAASRSQIGHRCRTSPDRPSLPTFTRSAVAADLTRSSVAADCPQSFCLRRPSPALPSPPPLPSSAVAVNCSQRGRCAAPHQRILRRPAPVVRRQVHCTRTQLDGVLLQGGGLTSLNTEVGDLSGEVVEVGSGVTNFKPGDKVVSISFPSGGGLAEYAVAPAALTVARPPEVSAVEGACLPAAASSALQLLKATGVSFDEKTSGSTGPKNVLVTAASGGVGHYAVQLAKLAGLHVTATCGARNVAFVQGLGADEVLDYKTPEGAALRSPSGRRYDAVANCAAGVSWPALRAVLADEGGTAADVTPGVRAALTSLLQKVTFAKKRLAPLMLTPKKEEMEWLVDLARQGKLRTVVDSRYPLSRAQEAWAKSVDGHATGKIVVEIGGAE